MTRLKPSAALGVCAALGFVGGFFFFILAIVLGGQWSASVLERVTAEGRAGEEGLNKLAFLVMGVMATLAALFKQGHRSALDLLH